MSIQGRLQALEAQETASGLEVIHVPYGEAVEPYIAARCAEKSYSEQEAESILWVVVQAFADSKPEDLACAA